MDFTAFKGVVIMKEELVLKNNLPKIRHEKRISQEKLASMVGVSRNTLSSIDTLQFVPTAKLALLIAIALDLKFEHIF